MIQDIEHFLGDMNVLWLVAIAVILVVVVSALGKVGRIGGAIAAAELVLAGVDNGHADVGGAASEGVGVVFLEVEHEVVYGFSGKFSPLEHHVKVVHEFALGYAFFQHVEHYSHNVP